MTRVNIGCGQTPTPGWQNYDNSLSLRIARLPSLVEKVLSAVGLLQPSQARYIAFCRQSQIKFADATRRIPEPSGSVEVVYSSHMVEHLGQDEALRFFKEALRILEPGGIIRIAVPDLRIYVDRYLTDQDGDAFVGSLHMLDRNPEGLLDRIKMAVSGFRGHKWVYDGHSLAKALTRAGFVEAEVMPAGVTQIADSGPLDLCERADESAYVEARKPL